MNDELTNLLPLDRLKILRRNYFIRFSVVGTLMLTFLFVAAAILLFPTYLMLSQYETDKKAILNSAATALSSAEEQSLSTRLITLTTNAKMLAALGTTASVSTRFGTILTVPRVGITLSGLAYTPSNGAAKGSTKPTLVTLAVSGTAATRDSLRNYQLALQGVPFVATATLPVSVYAQSTDIPFTITLTLTP